MTPSAIKSEAAKAGLKNVDLPTCSVAGETIDTGDEAKCFASYMRIHTLEATGGFTYSQMGRFQALTTAPKSELADGGGTDNATYAVTDPKTQQPVANGARDLWVTETALTTALNTSFFAERVALFSIVIGLRAAADGHRLPRPRLARRPEAQARPRRRRPSSDGDSRSLSLLREPEQKTARPGHPGGPLSMRRASRAPAPPARAGADPRAPARTGRRARARARARPPS